MYRNKRKHPSRNSVNNNNKLGRAIIIEVAINKELGAISFQYLMLPILSGLHKALEANKKETQNENEGSNE